MTSVPPPYAPGETKGLYPSVQGDPQQQPVVYTTPGTAAVTYYPSGPVQQPQQLVIQQAPVVVATQQPPQSFVCHILFSCCVTWCCFWPCGLLAFILAMVGYCMVTRSPTSARRLGTASIVFSILGILIVVIVAIGLFAYAGFNFTKLTALISGCHEHRGHCYRVKTDVLNENQCEQYHNSVYYRSNCYHD